MAGRIIEAASHDIHEYDLFPKRILRSNRPEDINLSSTLVKHKDSEQPRFAIRTALVSAAMQCISGTPDNVTPNLAMHEFTGVAGTVNCTQPAERQAAVIKKIKQAGAEIIPAAFQTHDFETRLPLIAGAGANLLLVDTSQGFSDFQKEAIEFVRNRYPAISVIGGNIVTEEGFFFLVEECGADGVKVGMGSGLGCITADVLGVSRRQATAISEVARARDAYFDKTGIYVPVYSDGGIKTFSDIAKAYALGADIVMVGRLLAGTHETPNPARTARFFSRDGRVVYQGPAKEFWYEASKRARMLAQGQTRDYSFRYDEGKAGWVAVSRPMNELLSDGFAIVRDAVRKAGCIGIRDLQKNAVMEIAKRSIDRKDPAVSMWDPEDVEIAVDGKWTPATELNGA